MKSDLDGILLYSKMKCALDVNFLNPIQNYADLTRQGKICYLKRQILCSFK